MQYAFDPTPGGGGPAPTAGEREATAGDAGLGSLELVGDREADSWRRERRVICEPEPARRTPSFIKWFGVECSSRTLTDQQS